MPAASADLFKPVNDEEVFLTRVREREERDVKRNMMAMVPIYEKSTATTRAPLKRVKEDEIKPAAEGANTASHKDLNAR